MSNLHSSTSHESLPPLDLDRVLRRVTQLSTLPHIAKLIVEIARDESVAAADLRHVVESDPALTTHVLRCVNSAAYGLYTKITSLQRAISYLGQRQVRNLALAASVARIFQHEQGYGRYGRRALWRHMVSVALAARMVAMHCRLHDFEGIFLAGLLHDIGLILEDQYCNAHFVKLMEGLDEGRLLIEQEQAVLGFNHTVVGARLAETWKFPPPTVAAARYHHMPDKYRGPHEHAVACVVLANFLCSHKGLTSVGMNLVRDHNNDVAWALGQLDLTLDHLVTFNERLDEELKLREELFNPWAQEDATAA